MSKNREDVLIHTHSPEFHEELVAILLAAHQAAVDLSSYFQVTDNLSPHELRLARFVKMRARITDALAQMKDSP